MHLEAINAFMLKEFKKLFENPLKCNIEVPTLLSLSVCKLVGTSCFGFMINIDVIILLVKEYTWFKLLKDFQKSIHLDSNCFYCTTLFVMFFLLVGKCSII